MKEVRLGVIGTGSMGKTHVRDVLEGKVKGCRVTAICDTDPAALAFFPGLKHFADSGRLIRSGEVDAVLVATPHYSHTTIGIDALENGLHLLVEKPLSVHVNDCRRLIAAHTDKTRVFAVDFMFRSESPWIKLRHMIQSGELGEIQRILWTNTDWFRPDYYFSTGGWRGTWAGEGGGVLVNQCPHNLDIWQWLFGMPSSLRAFCGLGKRHPVEVDDEVTAYMEYPHGATAVFITGTGEAPGSNRLEVAGDRGRVVLEDREIHFSRNETGAREFLRTSPDAYAAPAVWEAEVPVRFEGGTHHGVVQNFVDAILHGTPLFAPGEEGIHAVELANAMLYSSLKGKSVEFPLDGDAFERELKGLRDGKKSG